MWYKNRMTDRTTTDLPPARILGIESSCDETAAAVIENGRALLSNVVASQIDIHTQYGGVFPEVASRQHIKTIYAIVDEALQRAHLGLGDIDGIAATRGPGLPGSLVIGMNMAKGLSLAMNIPLVGVNHLEGHIYSAWVYPGDAIQPPPAPQFPLLALLVSGGHTELNLMNDHLEYKRLGGTLDDAAGEAFDKCGKVMGFSYPAGPIIDKLAMEGNRNAFRFAKPVIRGLDFSFSGLKTSFLYFLRDKTKEDPDFIGKNVPDLCASLQHTIVEILISKLVKASLQTGIKEIGIAGGVSANSGLRDALTREGVKRGWNTYIPPFSYTTDNAAMIGITGYYKYLRGEFAGQEVIPLARL